MKSREEGSNPRTVEPSTKPGCLDILKDEGHQGVRGVPGASCLRGESGGDQRLHLPSLVSRGTRETAGVRVKSCQFQLPFRNGRELNLFVVVVVGKEKNKIGVRGSEMCESK